MSNNKGSCSAATSENCGGYAEEHSPMPNINAGLMDVMPSSALYAIH